MAGNIAVILGSAFSSVPEGFQTRQIDTPFGPATLYEHPRGWALPRHGSPHRWLPNQIPYRAHAAALKQVGVESLLVTSSVGVLQDDVPLFTPLLVDDLVWLDNRLPDGTACTMWPTPSEDQGHLVVETGLFSAVLSDQVERMGRDAGVSFGDRRVSFWYAPGPRTKTRAENRVLAGMGLDVNSMTLAPEVVLANELGIACAAVVVGHKPSGPGLGEAGVKQSLVDARGAVEALVMAFLERGEAVRFENHVYRY